jgi:hypothetical protein
MNPYRLMTWLGLACLGAAVLGFVTGIATVLPLAAIALLAVGLASIALGLRGGADRPAEPTGGSPVSRGRAKIAGGALGLFGLVATVVAATVAEGEATGHAVSHLVVGAAALGLFSALAFLWVPARGTTAALVRGVVLSLLGVAAFGSFLESLGGAGYDTTNSVPRVEALAALHGVALPIAALGMPGLVLGLVTGVVVLATWATRRRGGTQAGRSGSAAAPPPGATPPG